MSKRRRLSGLIDTVEEWVMVGLVGLVVVVNVWFWVRELFR